MPVTNFGSILGRRIMTFKVSEDGKVVPAKYRKLAFSDWYMSETLNYDQELITARESFRRWKTARKAWRTRRRNTQQLTLPL